VGNETGLSRLVFGVPYKGPFIWSQGLSPLGRLASFGTTRDRPAVHATRAKCRETIIDALDLNFRCNSPHRAIPGRSTPYCETSPFVLGSGKQSGQRQGRGAGWPYVSRIPISQVDSDLV
jgi:hypothetical protein